MRRATTQFSIDSMSGLSLWLKAGSLSLSDGESVATWPDSSGDPEQTVIAVVNVSGASTVDTIRSGDMNSLDVRIDGATPRSISQFYGGTPASTVDITLNQLEIVAYTFSTANGTSGFRVDDTDSREGTHAYTLTQHQTVIGAVSDGSEPLNGMLYELITWNRVLSAAEIDSVF